MTEMEIAVVAEEVEAEIVRARLEAEGIPARIAPRSQVGLPAAWSPKGLGYGVGSFSIRVPAAHANDARRVLGSDAERTDDEDDDDDDEPLRPRASPVRIVATILLIGFLLSMALPVAQMFLGGR